jgi:hypothetical protein
MLDAALTGGTERRHRRGVVGAIIREELNVMLPEIWRPIGPTKRGFLQTRFAPPTGASNARALARWRSGFARSAIAKTSRTSVATSRGFVDESAPGENKKPAQRATRRGRSLVVAVLNE